MSTLIWLATRSDGRRWELWRQDGPRERDREMLGRLFIALYGDGTTSVGWFITSKNKRGRAAMKSATGRQARPRYSWKEEKAETLRAGAELLIEKICAEQ